MSALRSLSSSEHSAKLCLSNCILPVRGTESSYTPIRSQIDSSQNDLKGCQGGHGQLKEPISPLHLKGFRRTIIKGHFKCSPIIVVNESDRIGQSQRGLVNRGSWQQIIAVNRRPFKLATHHKVHQGRRVRRQGHRLGTIQVIPTVRLIIVYCVLIHHNEVRANNFQDKGVHGSDKGSDRLSLKFYP